MRTTWTLTASTDIVYSEDDGGWYLQQFRSRGREERVSKGTYPDKAKAEVAFYRNEVEWEDWR